MHKIYAQLKGFSSAKFISDGISDVTTYIYVSGFSKVPDLIFYSSGIGYGDCIGGGSLRQRQDQNNYDYDGYGFDLQVATYTWSFGFDYA